MGNRQPDFSRFPGKLNQNSGMGSGWNRKNFPASGTVLLGKGTPQAALY